MSRNFSLVAQLLLAGVFAGTTVLADTYNWNGSTTGGLGGVNNNWNTTDANWTGFGTTWPVASTGDDDAVFAGTAGTVTLNTAITANDLAFNTGTYTISSATSADTLTLDGTNPTISLANVGATINSPLAFSADGTISFNNVTAQRILTLGTNGLFGTNRNLNVNVTGAGSGNFSGLQINAVGGFSGSLSVTNNAASGQAQLGITQTAAQNALIDTDVTLTRVYFQLGNGNSGKLVQVRSLSGPTGSNNVSSDNQANTLVIGTNNAAFGTTTYSGNLTNGGGGGANLSLIKNGTATQVVAGANTYSGTTTINGGLWRAGATTGFSPNSAHTLANSAGVTLDLNNFNNTIGSLAGGGATGGNVTLGTATLTTGGNNSSTTFSGAISGNGGLVKNGTGTMTLAGNNSYLGTTIINNGALQISSASNLPAASAITISGNAALNMSATMTLANSVTIASGQTGRLRMIGTTNGTLSGNYSGVAGTLTLDVSGGSGYSGFLITSANGPALNSVVNILGTTNANNVQVGNTASLATQAFFANSSVVITATGSGNTYLAYGNGVNPANAQFGALDGGNATTLIGFDNRTGTVTIQGIANGNFAGTIFNGFGGSGPAALVKNGSSTQTLSGNNTYTGTTTINAGTLQIGNGGTTGTLGTGTVNNNSSLIFNRSNAHTVANAINGSGSVTKLGTGTTTFTGTSGYAGTTTVSNGTLLVNGTHTGGAGYTVASGATLGGTGLTASTLNVSGTLSPGASIESFASGALTMNSGSTFVFEADSSNPNLADLMAVNGALSLTNVNLDLTGANLAAGTWLVGDKLTLISYNTNTITSGFADYINDTVYPFGTNQWRFKYDDSVAGNNYNAEAVLTGTRFVTMTLVPEPSSLAMLAFGMLSMWLFRRRKG